eukprot:6349885-Prymnesium_polylepis.1
MSLRNPGLSVVLAEEDMSEGPNSGGPLRKERTKGARRSPYLKSSYKNKPVLPPIRGADAQPVPAPPTRPGEEITSLGMSSLVLDGPISSRTRHRAPATWPDEAGSTRAGFGSLPVPKLSLGSSRLVGEPLRGSLRPKRIPPRLVAIDAAEEEDEPSCKAADEAAMVEMLRNYDEPEEEKSTPRTGEQHAHISPPAPPRARALTTPSAFRPRARALLLLQPTRRNAVTAATAAVTAATAAAVFALAELYDEVQEAMDPFELRTVKQKLRAAIEAAIEATAGSAYWLGSGAVTPTLQARCAQPHAPAPKRAGFSGRRVRACARSPHPRGFPPPNTWLRST